VHRSIPGTKVFAEPAGERETKGTTDGARIRPVTLGCGCVKLFKVLPSAGDVVYCGRRHGFVKVPPKYCEEAAEDATD
jgi:hypothetical protein